MKRRKRRTTRMMRKRGALSSGMKMTSRDCNYDDDDEDDEDDDHDEVHGDSEHEDARIARMAGPDARQIRYNMIAVRI